MDSFITWDMFTNYASFVGIIFIIVAFTKELPGIEKLPTKYWSAFVTFAVLLVVNMHGGTFAPIDLFVYAVTAISVSMGANGLAQFNTKTIAAEAEAEPAQEEKSAAA